MAALRKVRFKLDAAFGVDHLDLKNNCPTIICVHGFACGGDDWSEQVQFLTKYCRVLTPDLRGHGNATVSDTPPTIEMLARDCIELIHANGLSQVIVAGHSLGVRVALETQRRAPGLIKGLILLDGSNSARHGAELAIRRFEIAISNGQFASWIGNFFRGQFFGGGDPLVEDKIVQRAVNMSREIAEPLYKSMIKWDAEELHDVLLKMRAPTLVIQATTRDGNNVRHSLSDGDQDYFSNYVAKLHADTKIHRLTGRGHFVHIEAASEVNLIIENWLIENFQ